MAKKSVRSRIPFITPDFLKGLVIGSIIACALGLLFMQSMGQNIPANDMGGGW